MSTSKCPFLHANNGTKNEDWFPKSLNLQLLAKNNERTDPMPSDFDYAAEFLSLDFAALKKDLRELMTDSKDWWPADYGKSENVFLAIYRCCWSLDGTFSCTQDPHSI